MNYFECCHHCVAPKRYPGCSGSCPEYKEARARLDADKARERDRTALDLYYIKKIMDNSDGLAKYVKRRPRNSY